MAKLHCIISYVRVKFTVVEPDYLLIIHVMPLHFRRGKR
jgi:hypothetical protein